ncbi:MAG: hypothetical protein A3J40_01730 [Erythrobacter sp. RIFCSPHIGHO2_12_FULL_63_10]|nr:MAG: hypothetical protein A3J40_01730 [Erythrobacter sp. RIFCSPHIGHO2_12_FULL_63_10]
MIGIDHGSCAFEFECDRIACRVFDQKGFGSGSIICLGESRGGTEGQTGEEIGSQKAALGREHDNFLIELLLLRPACASGGRQFLSGDLVQLRNNACPNLLHCTRAIGCNLPKPKLC